VAYSDAGDGSGSFEEGDVINVYCNSNVNTDYSSMYGVEYTFDGEKWTTDKPFYFDPNSTGSYTFNAYYYVTDDSDKYDYENMIIDQSEGLIGDPLRASTTCSARNPEAALSFIHTRSKITLYFTSVVTECKLIIESNKKTTICHLINDGKTAEAIMSVEYISGLTVQVTVDNKIYTGSINQTAFVENIHYIYNIKISDVLTVDSGTTITGFEDSGTTFEATQQ
jgi:hypothetical protein